MESDNVTQVSTYYGCVETQGTDCSNPRVAGGVVRRASGASPSTTITRTPQLHTLTLLNMRIVD